MVRRHEVRLLLSVGRTQKEVGDVTGVAERSIRRIEREAPVVAFDDEAERVRRRIGRPSKVAVYVARIEALLEAEPGMQTLEILRRVREDGYRGGKSALFDAVAKLRPRPNLPLVRFEGLPGEFSQHDFGEVDVVFLDGAVVRLHFFASRLKWSRWVQVSLVPDQRVEALVRALVWHFEAMGGVPLVAVFDRPKTVALEWAKDGRVTKWNSTFLQVMGELSVAPELCWPYQPKQKGSVENLVGWVKKSFFKARRFVDEADVIRQLGEWLDEVNQERESRATGRTPLERMEESERGRLRPLKLTSQALVLRHPVKVSSEGKVAFEGRTYSMPPAAVGQAGTLYLGEHQVRIVAGRWAATHARLVGASLESNLPEHRAAMVEAVKGPRAKLYLKRQQLQDLGQAVVDFLTELVHRRPRQWQKDVERLHQLLLEHGDAPVLDAITAANEAQLCGAEYVANFLAAVRPEVA